MTNHKNKFKKHKINIIQLYISNFRFLGFNSKKKNFSTNSHTHIQMQIYFAYTGMIQINQTGNVLRTAYQYLNKIRTHCSALTFVDLQVYFGKF